MKGDGRARTLMKLLDELPEGICLSKHADPKLPTLEETDPNDPGYQEWLKNLDKALKPSQEDPNYDFSGLPAPPEFEPPKPGPIWEVWFYDEYGESYDDTYVTLAENRDLVKALLLAKNRLRAGRALRGS